MSLMPGSVFMLAPVEERDVPVRDDARGVGLAEQGLDVVVLRAALLHRAGGHPGSTGQVDEQRIGEDERREEWPLVPVVHPRAAVGRRRALQLMVADRRLRDRGELSPRGELAAIHPGGTGSIRRVPAVVVQHLRGRAGFVDVTHVEEQWWVRLSDGVRDRVAGGLVVRAVPDPDERGIGGAGPARRRQVVLPVTRCLRDRGRVPVGEREAAQRDRASPGDRGIQLTPAVQVLRGRPGERVVRARAGVRPELLGEHAGT